MKFTSRHQTNELEENQRPLGGESVTITGSEHREGMTEDSGLESLGVRHGF